MRHININGGGINVVERGDRNGPSVVFVNSLGTDTRVWDNVVDRLEVVDVREVRPECPTQIYLPRENPHPVPKTCRARKRG